MSLGETNYAVEESTYKTTHIRHMHMNAGDERWIKVKVKQETIIRQQ